MIDHVVLAGDVVTLRPMAIDDVGALVAAATEDRTTYGFTPVPHTEPAMRAYSPLPRMFTPRVSPPMKNW